MSIRHMTDVFKSDLPRTEKLVALAIADCANDEGIAWPGYETLMRKTSIRSKTTLSKAIFNLVNAGWCDKSARSEVGRGRRANLYHIRKVQKMDSTENGQDTLEEPSIVTVRNIYKEKSERERIRELQPSYFTIAQWDELHTHRSKKKAAQTARAYKQLITEFDKAFGNGMTAEEILNAMSSGTGWAGFKYEWVQKNKVLRSQGVKNEDFTNTDYMQGATSDEELQQFIKQ